LLRLIVILCLALVAARPAYPGGPAAVEPPAAAPDERGPGVSVHPLVFDPPRVPLPVIRVRINDSEPLLFVVDTAWGMAFTLNNWVGERLKLPTTEDAAALNNSVPLRGVRVDTIELAATQAGKNVRFQIGGGGAVPIGDLDFIREGIGTGERVAGVIGAPLLAQTTVRFDFAAKTMTLFWQPHAPVNSPGGALTLAPPGATTLPMRAGRAEEPDFRYVTLIPVPGQSARLLIDTGSTRTSLPASVTARLKPRAAYPTISMTVASLYLEERLLLEQFRLGERVERLVTVQSDSAGDHGGPDTGLLGMDLLSRFRVTLDFRNNRLTLERPADYQRRVRVPGDAGIGLRRIENGYFVESVEKDSAAARAGVRAGDRVLRVDGVDIAPFSQNVADHVLNGFAGAPATLLLERPGA